MKDQKNVEQLAQTDSFFEKVEKSTPAQLSLAVIAKVMQKIKKGKKS